MAAGAMKMTETLLKPNKRDAIRQLLNMKPGDEITYSIGDRPGPHYRAMMWLCVRGGLSLAQRAHGKPGNKPRPFIYIAQRTTKPMTESEVRVAFNPKEWDEYDG